MKKMSDHYVRIFDDIEAEQSQTCTYELRHINWNLF